MEQQARLGFVGLGNMGGNMAARLLAAGYSVFGEERNREHAESLEHAGLQWCATPRELAERADIVFTSVPNDRVLEQVATGRDGILAGLGAEGPSQQTPRGQVRDHDLPPGLTLTASKIWVEMSTVSPHASRELATRVGALGATMLDAPVSGSVPQVQAGTLTIMVGGDADAYARVEPVLRELGSATYVGENGQGLVLKLAINISLAVQMLAFSEGLLLAERAGIDPNLASEVMAQSAIGSPMLKARRELVFDLPDEAWFDISFMQKDIGLALEAARELRVAVPSATAADSMLKVAQGMGYGRRDIAALYEVLGRLNGGQARPAA